MKTEPEARKRLESLKTGAHWLELGHTGECDRILAECYERCMRDHLMLMAAIAWVLEEEDELAAHCDEIAELGQLAMRAMWEP